MLSDLQVNCPGVVVKGMLYTYGIIALSQKVVNVFERVQEEEFDMESRPPPEWRGDGDFDVDEEGHVAMYTDRACKFQDERR